MLNTKAYDGLIWDFAYFLEKNTTQEGRIYFQERDNEKWFGNEFIVVKFQNYREIDTAPIIKFDYVESQHPIIKELKCEVGVKSIVENELKAELKEIELTDVLIDIGPERAGRVFVCDNKLGLYNNKYSGFINKFSDVYSFYKAERAILGFEGEETSYENLIMVIMPMREESWVSIIDELKMAKKSVNKLYDRFKNRKEDDKNAKT